MHLWYMTQYSPDVGEGFYILHCFVMDSMKPGHFVLVRSNQFQSRAWTDLSKFVSWNVKTCLATLFFKANFSNILDSDQNDWFYFWGFNFLVMWNSQRTQLHESWVCIDCKPNRIDKDLANFCWACLVTKPSD